MKRYKTPKYFFAVKIHIFAIAVFAAMICAAGVLHAGGENEAAQGEVQAWLETKPAVMPGDVARNEMLKKLDPLFQDVDAGRYSYVGKYFKARMSTLAADLTSAAPASGSVYLWKLYNHGAILKSRELTVAIDLIGGPDRIKWNADDLNRVINACDVLIITHGHQDHADLNIAKKFIAAGKKVVTPPGLWDKLPGMETVVRLRDGSLDINGVKITAYPSFQSVEPNNVYLLEYPGGVRIMHTGDENGATTKGGTGWLAAIKEPHPVEVMIQNTWSAVLPELIAAFPPKLIVPSHEHELSHGPASRSTYAGMIAKTSTLGVPFVMMAWGERIEIKK